MDNMERTALLPRHFLLLIMPIALAFLGGVLLISNLNSMIAPAVRQGISQAQFYLAISALTGALAFSWRYLARPYTWAIMLFLPVLFALVVYRQLGGRISFSLLSLLNIAFAAGIMVILRFTFFTRSITRIRTSAFAITSALLLTLYFKAIYLVTKLPESPGIFVNALFLFVFIGFGLSLADIMLLRLEIADKRKQTPPHQEDEETEDDI